MDESPGRIEMRRAVERNRRQPYCQAVVAPKVAKFRKAFVDRLKR